MTGEEQPETDEERPSPSPLGSDRELTPSLSDVDGDPELHDFARRVRGIFMQAIPAMTLAMGVDVLYLWLVEPRANLPVVLGCRMTLVALYAVFLWVVPPATDVAARRAMYLTGAAVVVLNALMAHVTGGLRSLYVLGLMLLGTAAAAIARPRREALTIQLAVFVLYGVTFAALTPLFAESMAQVSDPEALGFAVFLYVFCLASPFLSAEVSHLLWLLRREIFESKRVGRYILRKRIGRGGMGEVWSAWHVGLKREVAVKFLHAQMHDSVSRRRFTREARATASLQHPHTVRILDAGVAEDGQPFYAMELLSGLSLRHLVDREGPLAPARALRLAEQAARALGEAHARGIVHRDIKPENLFVCRVGSDESVKVLDFGIAKIAHDEEPGTKLTQTGWIAGTPAYIAPEVVQGKEAGPAADVYALGAALYFALTGTPPFPYELSAAVLFAHLHDPVEPLATRAGVPFEAPLEAVVQQALAKDPSARFADGSALAAALEAVPRSDVRTPSAAPRATQVDSEAPTRELIQPPR